MYRRLQISKSISYILCIDMARGKENTHDVLWYISRLGGETLLNKALYS